jgi:hypothetical protein
VYCCGALLHTYALRRKLHSRGPITRPHLPLGPCHDIGFTGSTFAGWQPHMHLALSVQWACIWRLLRRCELGCTQVVAAAMCPFVRQPYTRTGMHGLIHSWTSLAHQSARTHAHAHTYAQSNTHTHARTHARTHTHTYTHTHTHTLSGMNAYNNEQAHMPHLCLALHNYTHLHAHYLTHRYGCHIFLCRTSKSSHRQEGVGGLTLQHGPQP